MYKHYKNDEEYRKDKIEEMASDIKASLTHHFPKTILYPYIAQDLYALGYRKIPKNAVILDKEEYDEIKQYQSYIPKMKKAFDKVSKATAEKFAIKLADYFIENCAGRLYIGLTLKEWYEMIDEIRKEIVEGKG